MLSIFIKLPFVIEIYVLSIFECFLHRFYCTTLLPNFYLLKCCIPFISLYLQSEWKTLWILIRWLSQKLADVDPQCFQNRISLVSAKH